MKQEKEKKGLPFFGIPKLAPYLKPYKMLFFWMVVTGTVGSGMDAIDPPVPAARHRPFYRR